MKSTVDDLVSVYRQATRLGRAHKSKLITMLQEDVAEKPAKVSTARKKKDQTTGGGQGT